MTQSSDIADGMASSGPSFPPNADAAVAVGAQRDSLVMIGCATVGFSSLYLTQSLGPELHRLHGLSAQHCAALLTATTLGLAVASPLAGLVTQRLGARRALLLGLAALGLLNAGLAAAQGFPALLALRAAQGMVMPLALSALLTSIERQPSARLALGVSASYVTGTICGGVLGRLLPALLVPDVGWASAFLAMAALHGAALLLAAVGFRAGPTSARVEGPGRREGAGGPTLTAVYAGGFALLFSQMAVFTCIAFRLAEPPFSWSTAALGSLYLVFLPALALVRASRRVVIAVGHGRATVAAALVGWCGLLATLAETPSVVVAGLVGFSAAVFFAQAVLAHALSLCSAASGARASGGYLFFYYMGGSVGAVAAAAAWSGFGWLGCLGLVAALQGTLTLFVRVPRAVRTDEPRTI
jgi:MFS transporter, YNFM family, putative membrane transport protein